MEVDGDFAPEQPHGSASSRGSLSPTSFHLPGPFSRCHKVVAPQASFTSCVYGQCGTKGDAFTLCRSLQAYASLCARAGQVLTWRSSTFCRE